MCSLQCCRGIKKNMDSGEQPGEAATATMFKAMGDTLAEQKQELASIGDIAAMIAGQIGQLIFMNEKTTEQFRQFSKKCWRKWAAHKTRESHERCNDPGATEPGYEPYQGERY